MLVFVGFNNDSEVIMEVEQNVNKGVYIVEMLLDLIQTDGVQETSLEEKVNMLFENVDEYVDVEELKDKIEEFKKTIEGKEGFTFFTDGGDYAGDTLLFFVEGQQDDFLKLRN